MPTKPLQPTFTAAQQAMRARLAMLNPTQFVALRSVLQQAASAVDIRIAQLDAERAHLTNQKKKLATLLNEFGKPAALDNLRNAILKGQRFAAPTASIDKTPKPVPKKPKKPKKPGH
jgi:hypothetical protein